MGLYLNPGNESFRQAVTDEIEIAREFMRSVKAGGWDGLVQALEYQMKKQRKTY